MKLASDLNKIILLDKVSGLLLEMKGRMDVRD